MSEIQKTFINTKNCLIDYKYHKMLRVFSTKC